MFDRFVADTRPNWNRRAWIVGSLIAHIVGGGALIIYSIFHVEEIAPPALSLTFFSAPPPPPPPPPPPGRKHSEPKPTLTPKIETPKIDKIVQPVEKPPDKQPEAQPAEADSDDGEEGGEEGGEKGGEKGGQKGGTVGGVKPAVPSKPKEVTRAEFTLKKVNHPDPHLPDWFKNQHPGQRVEGRYKVCLNPDGHVAYVTTLVGVAGLDADIMNHIKGNWVYAPPSTQADIVTCFQSFIKFDIK